MRRLIARVFCVSLILNYSAGASTLGFDTLQPKSGMDRPIANGYGGLLWPSFKLFEGAWYTNGMVSPANVAVGTSSSSIYSGNLFDFNSAALTAENANGTLIRVQGLVGTDVMYENTYSIKTNAPTIVQFNYHGINRVNFLLTNSMFIMDNVSANIQCATLCSNYVISWHLGVDLDCAFPSNVVAIAAGYQHSLFLKGDSTVAACGSYKVGFLVQPLNIPDGLTNIIAVSGGDSHSLMLKSDGTVMAFGYDTDRQTFVPPGLSNVIAIAAGTRHSLALKQDGTVVGWGGGVGAVVPQDVSNVVAVSAGRDTSLALKADGTVTGWGKGNLSILNGLSNIVAVGAGDVNYYEAWMALQADGRLIEGPVSGAMRYLDVSNIVAISVSRGDDGSIDLALRSDGSMVAWGYNFDGTLGGGPLIPPELPPGFVVSIAAGDYVNLAVMSNAPPTPGPPLLSFGKEAEAFQVSVPTRSGRVYRLEYAGALNDPNWVGLPLVAGNGGTRVLTDSNATGGQRFYRVRHW